MNKEEYTCAMCKETFTRTWSDEEALAEAKGYFGEVTIATEELVIVCDDCYQKIHPAKYLSPRPS